MKGDYWDLLLLQLQGKNKGYRFIHCPWHEKAAMQCKVTDEGFFCFGCHNFGTINTLVHRIEKEKKTKYTDWLKGKIKL